MQRRDIVKLRGRVRPPQIVLHLKIEPQHRTVAAQLSQPQSHVRHIRSCSSSSTVLLEIDKRGVAIDECEGHAPWVVDVGGIARQLRVFQGMEIEAGHVSSVAIHIRARATQSISRSLSPPPQKKSTLACFRRAAD
jgi:hypothetical protein